MAGIYIHVPFCKQKCSYCDFHFSTNFSDYRQAMIDAICHELKLRKSYLSDQAVESIYFGGGTPSLLTESELQQLFQTIHAHFTLTFNPEITLEANPDDINDLALNSWKKVGINRLSIGLQSFKKSDLDWMNRAHTVEESLQCIQKAQSYGFDLLTVDLMYGLPGLTNEEWVNHIQKVISMNVQHISAYCLTVEQNTALNKWVKDGKISVASEEQQSEQFKLLLQTLELAGYHQYEISNFCLPGFEAVHNSNYWKSKHYLGVGPSAHSFDGTSRQWNIANNAKFIKALSRNEAYYEIEVLSPEDRFNEMILTGLRTIYGVHLDQLNTILSPEPDFYMQLDAFIDQGWMHRTNHHITLTKEGRLRADYIASELFQINH